MTAGFAEGMSRRERRERRLLGTDPVAVPDDGPASLLFVCTGNICRSPMAEVILRARLDALGVGVHSAGTHALVGHSMTPEAADLAIGAGARPADAAAHTARFLTEPMLRDADLVLTMTRRHRSHAVSLMPGRVRSTFTVREFAQLASALSDDEIRAAAAAVPGGGRARISGALAALTANRAHGAAQSADDDVVDPYRRPQEVYDEATAQLGPALAEVERFVRAAVS
ncbi:low molecular weight phosphatase family protein [Microbacterium sp. OR16]|uniref:arsenate reductase/protein-tyrosine-phosphatase family protein n=1 Tax=Microbacterium sp. OR16 TaxID=3095345 RepID=UPI0039B5FD3D